MTARSFLVGAVALLGVGLGLALGVALNLRPDGVDRPPARPPVVRAEDLADPGPGVELVGSEEPFDARSEEEVGQPVPVEEEVAPQGAPATLRPTWASYDPRVETNARHRAQSLKRLYEEYTSATEIRDRCVRARYVAQTSIFVLMDFERTSRYPEPGADGIMIRPSPDVHSIGNGGAAYQFAHGAYPVFDRLSGRGPVELDEAAEAALDELYHEACEILAPYVN